MGPGWENKRVCETPCEAPGRHAAGRTGRRSPSGRAASPPQHLSSGARRQVPGCSEHCGLPVNDVAGRDGWIGWGVAGDHPRPLKQQPLGTCPPHADNAFVSALQCPTG